MTKFSPRSFVRLLATLVLAGTALSAARADDQRIAQGQAAFHIIESPDIGSTGTVATAISADGRVIVGHVTAKGSQQAFRWDLEEGFTMLGDFEGGDVKSAALNVSADGSVIVGFGTAQGSTGNQPRAFRWSKSEGLKDLGAPPRYQATEAVAVSADGSVIAGHLGDEFEQRRQAFTWTKAKGFQTVDSTVQMSGKKFQGISYIAGLSPNGRVAAGSMQMSQIDFNNACVWVDGFGAPIQPPQFSEGTSRFMPAFIGTRSVVIDVWNDQEGVISAIVGRYQNKNRSGTRGFRIANRKFDWLETGSVQMDWPIAISKDGEKVVGSSRDDRGGKTAAIWSPARGVKSVAKLLTDAGVPTGDWTLTEATDISADGRTIVGTAKNAQDKLVTWKATLP